MRLLDLFCGEGGAAAGYLAAGWDVVGVDNRARVGKRYPGRFIHGDALEHLFHHGDEFDAIHASPPCQRFTHGNVAGNQADRHPDLITPTRAMLDELTGRPWVIENVPRSPLRHPLVLCGSMFGLTTTDEDGTPLVLRRHRWFESNMPLTAPGPCRHVRGEQVAGSYGGARRDKDEARKIRKGGYVPAREVQERLLGITWMTGHGLTQAVPPAYTQWVGRQLAGWEPDAVRDRLDPPGEQLRIPW